MSNFECNKCFRIFKFKHHLQNHEKSKRKCDILTEFQCKNCLKYFKSNYSLSEHKICKAFNVDKINELKKEKENKKEPLNNDDSRKINAIKAIINCESLDIDSKINLLKKYNLSLTIDEIRIIITSSMNTNEMIDTLLSFTNKPSETTINNINNSTINTTNNIQINNFGKENVEYLNNEYFKVLLSSKKFSFEKIYLTLTKDIYLRVDHPENRTVKIENLNNKYAFKYENGKWKGILKSELKELLDKKNKKLIKVHLESLKDENEKNVEKISNYLNRNSETDPFMKDLNERNILLLYTGKNKNEI